MFDERDPRLSGEYVRRHPGTGDDGDVIVAGVVHEHPASTYRVQSVIDEVEPDVVALELPPLAVPLFQRYATDEQRPPASGGEMSAAIQAAPRSVVGIDGPTLAFLRRLAGKAYRSDVGLSTARKLASGVLSVTRHAVGCRIAASVDGFTASRPAMARSGEHDCDWSDPPDEQAADEQHQIRRAKSVKTIFGEPGAVTLRDAAREAHMADRLSALREDGTVVAVVGVDHLEPLSERLD